MVMFGPSFMLLPSIENVMFQESFCKKYEFVALSPSSLKIVLTLLTNVITIHLQNAIIEVRVLDFEKLVCGIFSRLRYRR